MFGRSRRVPVYEEAPVATTAEGVPASAVTTRARAVEPVLANPGAGAGLGTIAFFTIVLGAWAGIVPFVGPLFGYSATGHGAWLWNLPNALLWLVPGAVAVFFGFVLASRAPAARYGMGRIGPMTAGLIIACCGAWLAIGPFCWRVLEGAMPIRPAGPLHEFIYWVGYAIGPGIILALLGGAAVGIAMVNRRTAPVASVERTVTREPIAA